MTPRILEAMLPSIPWIALAVIVLTVVLAALEKLHSGHWPSARSVVKLVARLLPWGKRSEKRRKRQRPAAPDEAADRGSREV
jgi:hypothetical protein